MNDILTEMIKKIDAENKNRKNAVKEVMQEIVLCGLSRAGFFKKAAFYGGTALRIFYGLDRFSEDLDFSLLEPNPDFRFSDYFPILEEEAASFGLHITVTEKEKTKESAIRSAFLKGNTKEHILLFYADDNVDVDRNETIKIKFEVDTMPPAGAGYEHKYRLLPAPYDITMFDLPSLFAGKVHAVICRSWKNRVKGRDLYDYIFYLSRVDALNLAHLKARLVESGAWSENRDLGLTDIKTLLFERFDAIDYEQAKADVTPFVKNNEVLRLWSADFFKKITEDEWKRLSMTKTEGKPL